MRELQPIGYSWLGCILLPSPLPTGMLPSGSRPEMGAAAARAIDLLVLETLFFADEVRDPHQQIPDLPGRVKLSRQELSMARQLIEGMAGPWRPSDYRDTYTDRVNKLIDAKKNDREFQPADEAPTATNVVDLADALRASVQAAGKTSGNKAPTGKPGRKKRHQPVRRRPGDRAGSRRHSTSEGSRPWFAQVRSRRRLTSQPVPGWLLPEIPGQPAFGDASVSDPCRWW